MRNLNILILTILLISCEKQKECEVCELIKNQETIEKYESCEKKVMRISKSVCEEMAKTKDYQCKCTKTNNIDKRSEKEISLFETVDSAREYVNDSFSKQKEILLISDKLNDAIGLNMALIGDLILKKGYLPDGFEQKEGYRIYRYKKSE